MCGIVGFVGVNAESILVSRLKQLEYRGYDSAGIATLGEEGLKVFKSKGEIKNLENIIVPQTKTYIGTVYNILPWQIIAYYTSVNKGINPDKPRNLAKSVTVE